MKINIRYIKTEDDLRLQGIEYESQQKDLCILFIHGMSGNFIENYFASVLGEELAKENIGFMYAHNRGYNHINDIATSEFLEKGGYKTIRIGTTYEIFTDCLKDIEAWMRECKKLGYKKIILAGHSLGSPKVIYYFSNKKPEDILGVILLSPGDMVGLIKKPEYQPNAKELFKEARESVARGEPRKLLSKQIWDWYTLSSQTFLSLFEENGPVDNLPVNRKEATFEQLAKINVPILCIMGEYDDIAINTLEEDMEIIAAKATNSPSVTKKFIPKANHTYDGQELRLAQVINEWIKKL